MIRRRLENLARAPKRPRIQEQSTSEQSTLLQQQEDEEIDVERLDDADYEQEIEDENSEPPPCLLYTSDAADE